MAKKLDRKLAAILYADVAGYSRLAGDDEDATHRRKDSSLRLNCVSVVGGFFLLGDLSIA